MYAIYFNGQIVGQTQWPNPTSSTPVDESSREWLDWVAARDHAPTGAEELNERIQADPVLKAIVDEIDTRNPGFLVAARARM